MQMVEPLRCEAPSSSESDTGQHRDGMPCMPCIRRGQLPSRRMPNYCNRLGHGVDSGLEICHNKGKPASEVVVHGEHEWPDVGDDLIVTLMDGCRNL